MNDESPYQKQLMSLVLTGQQREVLEALNGKEKEEYPLSNWYLGALYALDNHYNPDRISQAAQSLRELLEKLPRAVRELDAQGRLYDFKGIRRTLHDRFSRDKERYKGRWRGEVIDATLDKTLRKSTITLREISSQLGENKCRRRLQHLIQWLANWIAGFDKRSGTNCTTCGEI